MPVSTRHNRQYMLVICCNTPTLPNFLRNAGLSTGNLSPHTAPLSRLFRTNRPLRRTAASIFPARVLKYHGVCDSASRRVGSPCEGYVVKRLIEEAEIRRAVDNLGRNLASDYHGRRLTILGVLTGSIILISDLMRKIDLPLRVGLIQASSYRGRTTEPGTLTINSDLLPDIEGRDVLLVDDIYDTGQTLSAVLREIRRFEPRSVRSAVLLLKEGRRNAEYAPDYHCFKIPNMFVVGYGLDYNDEYRHLPYVAALEDDDL